MTTEQSSTWIERLYRNPGYLLAVVGAVLGYVTGGSEGAILGAVLGFFVGKTVQSLSWTLNAN